MFYFYYKYPGRFHIMFKLKTNLLFFRIFLFIGLGFF
nr:SVM family protein [Columbia Basin potato purple top phytoplasma]